MDQQHRGMREADALPALPLLWGASRPPPALRLQEWHRQLGDAGRGAGDGHAPRKGREQGGRRSDEADNSSVRLMDGQMDSQTAGVGLDGMTEGQRGLRKQRDSWLLKGWGTRLEGWLGR